MKDTINFLLSGVGGQGTILASDVLANVGLAGGYQVKQAEVHGMSQRGGSVTSHVRWGKMIYSPLIGPGEVDVLLAFEKVEALRVLNQLRLGALILVNLQAIAPITVTSGGQPYPDDAHLIARVAEVTDYAVYLDGQAIGESLGSVRTANVVLLGALSQMLATHAQTGPEITPETWLEVIVNRVPKKTVEINRLAFQAGRDAVAAQAPVV